ncbi:MAG TPA: hypothetical protein VEZ14_10945 [Dehalococcoidia bacterium]|nr:hypothetical protein [Dehalococcoidia bacterium]
MTFAIKLTHDEPRLVYLALVYHLARPGSELDPATRQISPHALRSLKTALGNQLDAAEAIVELDAEQYRRLLSAIYGCVNELRVHHMRAGAPGGVPRFAETAVALFPALATDPDAAIDLSESMMMLHRRMERAVRLAAEAPPAPPPRPAPRRPWWRPRR